MGHRGEKSEGVGRSQETAREGGGRGEGAVLAGQMCSVFIFSSPEPKA